MNTEDTVGIDEVVEESLGDELVTVLIEELDLAMHSVADISSRQASAQDTRFCVWPGQSEDGRKHKEDLGVDAFPFEGASDRRVMLVDALINEDVEILTAAFWGAKLKAVPTSFARLGDAALVNVLLEWVRSTGMRQQLIDEVELLAQYMNGDDPGAAVLGVFWEESHRTRRVEVSLLELESVGVPAAMLERENVNRVDQLFAVARGLARQRGMRVDRGAIEAALEAFDADEFAQSLELPLRVVKGRPAVRAYRLGSDIFMDFSEDDLQDCRAIFTRERLNPTQLRARVDEEGWDEEWVDLLLETAPRELHNDALEVEDDVSDSSRETEAAQWREVWTVLRWVMPEDSGAPEVWKTVFSPKVAERVALDEPLGYSHGMYPFWLFLRERVSRGMLSSRGISRIATSHQTDIKSNQDSRNNALQLSVAPPFTRKVVRGGVMLGLAPFKEVRVRHKDDFNWLTPPPFPSAAMKMEEATRMEVDDYFGRVRPDGSPTRSMVKQQRMVDRWLGRWSGVFGQIMSLVQQYMDASELAAILSVETRQEVRDVDLSGEYTLNLSFDVRDLDMEFLDKKLTLLTKVVGFDTQGIVDMTLVKELIHAVDPFLARERVRDVGNVTEQEQQDERMNVVLMSAGIEPPMREKGQNHALRLQTIQETIQASPKLAEQFESDEDFRARVENRLKHLDFVSKQGQRAAAGAVGAKPVDAEL